MMKVTMLLADAAQVVDNKLYILGGGWSVTGPDPMPSAIALKLDVPWDEAGKDHIWELALLDQDGVPVFLGEGEAAQSVVIRNEFQLERPDHLAPGTPLELAMALNLAPLPLEPGNRYAWHLTIDDQSQEDWQVAFSVRPRAEV
jgi:hypothetical protein